MTSSKHPLLFAISLLGVLASGVCHAQTFDLDALYARPAEEREVSIYLQGPPQVYAEFVRQFEAKYPKVKVRITPGRYDLLPKIDEQLAAGKLDADLAILQTTQDYVRWKRQGALISFAPPSNDNGNTWRLCSAGKLLLCAPLRPVADQCANTLFELLVQVG